MSQDTIEQFGYQQELKRDLGFGSLILFGIAMMLPIAPVTIFGEVSTVSMGHLALCYILAVIPMSFSAWSYGQMAGAFPVAGSAYAYTQRSINPFCGFVAGWSILLDYALFPALNYIVIAIYAQELFPSLPFWGIVIASIAIVSIVNVIGIKSLSRINNILVIFMFLVIIYFIISAFTSLAAGAGNGFSMKPFYNGEHFSFNAVLAGTAIACFSFMGFDAMTTLAEEVKKPNALVKATVIVCFIMGGLFILQAWFAQNVFPDFTAYSNNDAAFIDVAIATGGKYLAQLISIAMIAGCIGHSIDSQAGVVRILYGMGRDNFLPKKFFSYLHPKTKVPVLNVCLIAAVSILLCALLDLSAVINCINFGALTAFMFVNLSVIFHYYIKNNRRQGWDILKYLVVPALGFIICFTLFIMLSTQSHILGASWLVIGISYLAIKTKGFRNIPKLEL